MMPASNMKILTLAVAAETLGWDYRFTTTLEARGTDLRRRAARRSRRESNGDPDHQHARGRGAAVLRRVGARAPAARASPSIDGGVIGDDQAFDDEGIGAGWAWDYLQYDYAAPVGALQYNEDVADA